MKKLIYSLWMFCGLYAITGTSLVSCDDDPSAENYVVSTGQMISQYVTEDTTFSSFATVLKRAGMMDLLSAYGHYTCFAPTNEAFNIYLESKGKTLDELTESDCDTIAKTHLVNAIYTTYDMYGTTLSTLNLMGRPIETSLEEDANGNSVVILNRTAKIIFETRNDSVENGMMQPIDRVLESSTDMLPTLIKKEKKLSLFCEAWEKTGLFQKISTYMDENYENNILPNYSGEKKYKDYTSGAEPTEYATPPDHLYYGFTAFVVPDSTLKDKYGITDLQGLFDKACEIYGNTGTMDDLKNPENPLYKFMAYHIMDRKVRGYKNLTCQAEEGTQFEDFGFFRDLLNPNDWYGTMLPYSKIKVERLTADIGDGVKEDWYLNRRYNDKYSVEGSHVFSTTDSINQALNGIYFYIDDILKYDEVTKETVMNCRMRNDMSSVFPELMNNDIRMNGNISKTGEAVDHTQYVYGRNYFFPNGYLDGVTVGGNGYFIYRRPRQGYWSLHGDEFICQGDYDVTFRIPSVPFESEWQVRLGYAAMEGRRGVAQVYFGEDPNNLQPQGIPLDMNRDLRVILYNTTSQSIPSYSETTESEKQEERKTLKNKGYYRGCYGGFRTGGTDQQHFYDIYATLRIVLCTYHMKPNTDYYLRLRAVSSKTGNDNEAMLDYLELVPKSVWGVTDGDEQEDDL